MTAEMIDQLFVFVGLRPASSGGTIVGFVPIDTIDATASDERTRWFKPNKYTKPLSVGGIYRAPASATALRFDFTRAGRYGHEDQITSWRVLSDAAEVAERMRKLEKTDRLHDTIAEVIEPIRAAYQKTDTRGKRAIEALVLAALRKGS